MLEYIKLYFQRKSVDKLIKEFNVVKVGNGYIDCIVPEKIDSFIDELTKIGVFVTDISWWCHCTLSNKKLYGCPHGMGGPQSDVYAGFFSELNYITEVHNGNKDAKRIIHEEIKKESWYSPCLVPGLWLSIDKYFLKRGRQ
ncbi:MAG: hypothetical protein J6E38_03875 [Clostridia bacterium]|nr:hypothetical protein [Clostridia bacterium]